MSDHDNGSNHRRMPVQLKSGVHHQTSEAIVAAKPSEVDLYGDQRRTTCATCRHFRHQAGQDAMKKERFIERLVLEEQWKVRHLGAPPATFGLCGQSPDTLTSVHTKSCDHYAPANGRIREPGDWNK